VPISELGIGCDGFRLLFLDILQKGHCQPRAGRATVPCRRREDGLESTEVEGPVPGVEHRLLAEALDRSDRRPVVQEELEIGYRSS